MQPDVAWWLSAEVDYQRRNTHVNTAFLLVTTAWLAGAEPAPMPAPAPAPAPVVAAPAGGCGSCGAAPRPPGALGPRAPHQGPPPQRRAPPPRAAIGTPAPPFGA